MSLSVTALVIGGNPDYLEETIFGIQSQSRSLDKVLVGCTSETEREIAKRHDLPHIDIDGNFQKKLTTLVSAVEEPDWFWVLFSDSCPDPDALHHLALTAETSPSASVIAPKLVQWQNPKTFRSFGNTLTPFGESFALVDSEMDQGQHDLKRDVLAADFAGSLLKAESIGDLPNAATPMSASSTLFGIKQWVQGHRVLLEAKSIVRLGPEHGIDGSSNLLGAYFAKRYADYHLALISSPIFWNFFMWLLLPLVSIIRSIWLVGSRRVRYFFAELSAGFAAFFSLPAHLSGYSELRKLGKLKSISSLRVGFSEIRDRSRRRFSELPPVAYKPGLLSGPWAWLMPLALVANYRLVPSNEVVLGGNFLPLNANWAELLASSWLMVDGFPINPVLFPLSFISAFSFWAPSVALGWFVFLAPALAFAGVWLALSKLTEKKLLISSLSLAYAIGPLYSFQLLEPDVGLLISFVGLGWLIHGLIMVIQSSVSSRAWRWMAWSGFVLAMVGAASPMLIPVLLVSIFALSVFNLKRIGFLVFAPIPLLVVVWPSILYWITNPLTIFAPQGGLFEYSNDWQFQPFLISMLALLLLALTVFVLQPRVFDLVLLVASSFSVLAFAVIEHLQFKFTESVSQVSANGQIFLALGFIAVAVVVVRNQNQVLEIVAIIAAVSLAVVGLVWQTGSAPGYQWDEYRQVPAIVEVESQRFELNSLIISESGDEVYLRAGNGENLGEQSNLKSLLAESDSDRENSLSQLTASLIASNSEGVQELMQEWNIAFVELAGENPNLSSQLSRIPELTYAGQTISGGLWRADQTSLRERRISLRLEQLIPISVLLASLVIAIPTPGSIRGRSRLRGQQ